MWNELPKLVTLVWLFPAFLFGYPMGLGVCLFLGEQKTGEPVKFLDGKEPGKEP